MSIVMRYCLLALILQSVTFCAAGLEEYQKPHVAEEQKSFTCDKRFYNSATLNKYRDENGNFPAKQYSRASLLDFLFNISHEQQTTAKVMYAGDKRSLKYQLMPIFTDHQPAHVTSDILVFDNQSRACAIITEVELITPSPRGGGSRSKKSKSYKKFCHLH
ncbi:unnamed protein product [Blumeria hordei]|uniref:Uncharacterized protein n=1 Tax=Blumeria hordei TaxID=2867405 RepID=A0A383UP56_BLUHO|nr:unnamed protein product [Blumeria hordei]